MLILFLLHVAGRYLVHKGLDRIDGIARFSFYFNLDNEHNIPTFFSSGILLISALLLFVVPYLTQGNKKDKRYWHVLSFIFLFLSLDEGIELHERLITPLRQIFVQDLSGFLYWGWVVPYSILLIIVAAYFLKFILRLPGDTRNKIILSGFVFVFGAVVIESIEGYFYKAKAPAVVFEITITTQEVLEMLGIIMFIKALLEYIVLSSKAMVLHNSDKKQNLDLSEVTVLLHKEKHPVS